MLSENSPATPLPPSNNSRNNTPSKIIRLVNPIISSNKNVSPLVAAGVGRAGSNPRSSGSPRPNSNSRNIRVIQRLTQQETLSPPSQQQQRATSRSASRRKQRRWENSHLFGIQEVLSAETFQQIIGAKEHAEEGEDSIGPHHRKHYTRYLFPIDEIKSAFADLFLHQDLLSIFRRCEEELTAFTSSSCSSSSTHSRMKQRSIDEQCWLNIERKKRKIFLSLLPPSSSSLDSGREEKEDLRNLHSFQFLLRMESLLYAFIEDQLPKGKAIATVPPRDTSTFHSPLLSYIVDEVKGSLRVDLVESSFYRLLFHGVCEFYGLKSQSFVIKESKNKYIEVTKPKKVLVAFENQISLTKYLYWKILSEELPSAPVTTVFVPAASKAEPVAVSQLETSESSTPTTLGHESLSTVSLGGEDTQPPTNLGIDSPADESLVLEDYVLIEMNELALNQKNSSE